MRIRTTFTVRLSILLFWFVLSPLSYALNIGSKQLNSSLNQKLDANVELLGVRENQIASIRVKLASHAIYRHMGLERSNTIEKLSFSPQTNDAGIHFVHFSLDGLITEALLKFLVELRWPTGYSLRQLTVFLDPPIILDEDLNVEESSSVDLLDRSKDSTSFSGDNFEESGSSKVRIINGTKFAFEEIDEPVKNNKTQVQFPIIYEKVRNSESLWDIAEKTRPKNVTVEQMIIALQKENPHAFIDNNYAFIKPSAVFRINNLAAITKFSPEVAISEISRQHKEQLAQYVKPQAKDIVNLEPKNHQENLELITPNIIFEALYLKSLGVLGLSLVLALLLIWVVRSIKFWDFFLGKSIPASQIQCSLNQLFPQKKLSPNLDKILETQTEDIIYKSTNLAPQQVKKDNREVEVVNKAKFLNTTNLAIKEEKDRDLNDVSADQVLDTLKKLRNLIHQKRIQS